QLIYYTPNRFKNLSGMMLDLHSVIFIPLTVNITVMRNIHIPAALMFTYSFFSSSVSGQNLLPNGSFELYYSCPTHTNEVDSCKGWHGVLNTPDYFNTCSNYPVSIPDNIAGDQLPFEGNAYAGLATYTAPNSNYREIIGSQLIGTLIPGNTY